MNTQVMMMNNTIKVYTIGPDGGYSRPIHNKLMVNRLQDADVVVLTGGADVDPSTYNRKNLASYGDKYRDLYEISQYRKIRPNQVVLGTCRGAQLLTVLNGGNLVQDVTNHGLWGTHNMIDKDGNQFEITSLHHQMCYPFDIPKENYDLLMVSAPSRSDRYVGDGIDDAKIIENGEPELIVYKTPGHPISVAIQGHPEMMDKECDTVIMLNELIKKCIYEAKRR